MKKMNLFFVLLLALAMLAGMATAEEAPLPMIDVREAPSGMSAIIHSVPQGTAWTILAIEGDWVQVQLDGVTGYVYIDDAGVEKPETEEMKVTIFTSRRAVMAPGEIITLTSKLQGLDAYNVSYQWMVNRGSGFENVPGATGPIHQYEATIESLAWDWQLALYVTEK